MGTKIVELWVEIHHADSEKTPDELLGNVDTMLREYAASSAATKLIVIRTNAFEAPDPEPAGQDPEDNPIPDDGSTGGDG